MFDVSFSELLVIVVVALVVIGPEKLPKVARTLGAMSGRIQRYIAQVKEEVNREVRFEELQALQSEIKARVAVTQQAALNEVAEVSATLTMHQDAERSDQPVENNLSLPEAHQADLKNWLKNGLKNPQNLLNKLMKQL